MSIMYVWHDPPRVIVKYLQAPFGSSFLIRPQLPALALGFRAKVREVQSDLVWIYPF